MADKQELWKTLRWFGALAALVFLGWMVLKFVNSTASGAERSLDKILGALTNSDTRIVEGRAEVVERNEIAELALMELRMSATRSYENESYILKYVPAGTKQLIIRGDYRITAGYRLEPGVSLQYENGKPVARFPEPEILSAELIDYKILNHKDGWWNDITDEDRSMVLRQLRHQMRAEAEASGVLDVVEATLSTRLKDLMGEQEIEVQALLKEE